MTLEHLRSKGIKGRTIPLTDLNSVTVPGAASGWVKTVEEFGSGTLSLSEILAPAIRMAEEGVPTAELHANAWQGSEGLIQRASPHADAMLLNGKAPLASHVVKFPHLARTFRAVAEDGNKGFYTGRIAEAIVELVRAGGGVMSMEDLANHTADVVEPIKYEFKQGEAAEEGVTLYEVSAHHYLLACHLAHIDCQASVLLTVRD